MSEVNPDVIQKSGGKWKITAPLAQSGGGLFAVVTSWCSHCSQLKKNIPKAQELMPFDFYMMDGEKTPAHEAKVREMGIRGYPSMYYISRDGYLQEYNAARTPEAMAEVFHRR